MTNSEQNVTVISQMRSLESYSLSMHYGWFADAQAAAAQVATNQTTNRTIVTNRPVVVQAVGFILSFEVSYKPNISERGWIQTSS